MKKLIKTMQASDKNIILIGFMGSGKSTLGRALSRSLKYSFLDTDELIEKEARMTVTEIFNCYGEGRFRRLERNCCKLASLYSGHVIATGGGIVKDESNIDVLRRSGIIIYLKASEQKISDNLEGDLTRPLLSSGNRFEKIHSLLAQRMPLYEAYSDITLDVSGLSVEESSEQLLEMAKGFIAAAKV